jgi:DNA mismatch repair protein MutS
VRRTGTAAGARLLAEWLAAPLTDLGAIAARQDGWGWLVAQPRAAGELRAVLKGAPDMARALGRLSLGRGGPRDLVAVAHGLAAGHRVVVVLDGPLPAMLGAVVAACDVGREMQGRLAASLAEPAPLRAEAGMIAVGFDAELDAERGLRDDSRRVIAAMQLDFAQRYGVASLKIKHHAQLGYVVEVPAASVEKLRGFAELTLRQGMANGARFTCPELSELDRKISEAAERALARERAIFSHLVAAVLRHADAIAGCAAALARLDVLLGAAALAEGGSWCRAELGEDESLHVTAGRHPVVQAALAGGTKFIANDCHLSGDRRVLLLTGPNMAGKSTFLRQNALIVVLAQAGMPVPAAAARIGVVDRLFSRVGASDDLARGRSTFMVEMTETAAILHQAGPRSLVVVDEIGRGTATLDGLAIAWAVLEALHNSVRCRTIFATHFHELGQLTAELPRLSPHTMRVREWKQEVVFLHEVAEGSAGRSWGVHVARLAGVPGPVVKRAGGLLAALEERAGRLTEAASLPLFAAAVPEPVATDKLREAVMAVDPDALTPREALEALYRLRGLV